MASTATSSGTTTTAKRRLFHKSAVVEDRSVPMGSLSETSSGSTAQQQVRRRRRRRRNGRSLPFQKTAAFMHAFRNSSQNLAVCILLLVSISFVFLLRLIATTTTAGNNDVTFGGLMPRISFQSKLPSAPMCSALRSADDLQVTLVTQLSDDRLWMMQSICQRWRIQSSSSSMAPMALAVWTHQGTAELRKQLEDFGCDTSQIAIRRLGRRRSEINNYPVNVLRNIAVQAVRTSHILYLDVDFWPSADLVTQLQSESVRQHLFENPQAVVVVPAFQLERTCESDTDDCPHVHIPRMPETTNELVPLLQSREAQPFDPYNSAGHGSTLYGAWLRESSHQLQTQQQNEKTIVETSQANDALLELPCVNSNRYEPYLVVRYCRDHFPPFQESFSGYGKNKMTWVLQLIRQGAQLFQLPHSGFVVHYPHAESPSRLAWNGHSHRGQPPRAKPSGAVSTDQWLQTPRGRTDHLYWQFRHWLDATIPAEQRQVPKCPQAEDDDHRLWMNHEEDQHIALGKRE